MSSVYITDIIFISSVNDKESMLTRKLYRELQSINNIFNEDEYSRFTISIYEIKSKEEYSELMTLILLRISKEGRSFMFHIDMHGNDKGLRFVNGEEISWKIFYRNMSILNRFANYNQVINFSVCYSLHFFDSISIDKPCPFSNCIYSRKEVNEKEIENFYSIFYREFIKSSSLITAFDSAKKDENNFIIAPSIGLFDHLIDKVIKDLVRTGDDDDFFGNFKYIIDFTEIDEIDELKSYRDSLRKVFLGSKVE